MWVRTCKVYTYTCDTNVHTVHLTTSPFTSLSIFPVYCPTLFVPHFLMGSHFWNRENSGKIRVVLICGRNPIENAIPLTINQKGT